MEDEHHFLHAQHTRTIFPDLGWSIDRDKVFYRLWDTIQNTETIIGACPNILRNTLISKRM